MPATRSRNPSLLGDAWRRFARDRLARSGLAVLAILMLSSVAIVLSNLAADVLYGVFDPRIVYR